MLNQVYTDNIIKTALAEDINYIDVTTDNLIGENHRSVAYLVSKDDGILCGINIAARVFDFAGGNVKSEVFIKDGASIKKGDIIANFKGSTKTLLKGERTALNILQHMSGVATVTNKYVQLVKGTNAVITDTRKTLPGLRALEKHAVVVGGGRNHRFNLSDGAMLKDNHIDSYGSIKSAVAALRKKCGHMLKVEVEVRNFDELTEALECGCEVIMLDNMSLDDMAMAVKINNGRAKLEASGNMNLDRVREVALTGVDIISIGAITHSVKCFDISMKIRTSK